MEYIRVFQSQQDAEQQLAQITHPTLSAVRGGGFIGLHQGASPTPPGPVIDPTVPFYIEDVSGSENTVQITPTPQAPICAIDKSTDGETWEFMGYTSATITATIPANGRLYLRCNTTALGNNSSYNTINTTGDCNLGGNIMSLLYGSDFTGNEINFPSDSFANFYYLFKDNTHIISAANLLLPATTLTYKCYYYMFSGCTSLTAAPALPATTLANNCYDRMFVNCTSLTSAPALPATTLTNYCYQFMFQGCTSLTSAPELPATTLVQACYSNMFYGCSNLNYIKCLATNKSATQATYYWTRNVASSGTFVKDPNISESIWGSGSNGIPSGWTVEDAA